MNTVLTEEDWNLIQEAYTDVGTTQSIKITASRSVIVTILILEDREVALQRFKAEKGGKA